MEIVDGFGIALLVAFVLMAGVIGRVIWLRRRGAQLDLAVRRVGERRGRRRPWHVGLGRMRGDVLQWWRLFGFSVRPACSLQRTSLQITERRLPHGPETIALAAGSVILRCRVQADGHELELALSESMLPALMAWLESAPPGAPLPLRSY